MVRAYFRLYAQLARFFEDDDWRYHCPEAPGTVPPDLVYKRDADCVISTFYACCSENAPHALRKDLEQRQRRQCEEASKVRSCIDIEGIENTWSKKSFVAKCTSGTCTAVER